MSGQRQPISLIQAKGKKHLTKAEIAERQRTEVKAPADKVTAPSYLTPTQKKAFREKYKEITQQIAQLPLMVDMPIETKEKDEDGRPIYQTIKVVNSQVERLAIMQDRYFRQCRQGAADFGLTVSSRCRLIVPKAPEAPKGNKFDKFA